MPWIPTWIVILGLSLTPKSAQAEGDSTRIVPVPPIVKTQPQIASGDALVNAGTTLAVGGLTLMLAGYLPEVRLTGMGAFYLGVPMIGLGAMTLGRAAERADSTFRRSNPGWGWFLSGLAMGGYGSYEFSKSLRNIDPGAFLGSTLMVIGGLACEGVAWWRFQGGIESSRKSLRTRTAVTLEPIFLLPTDAGLPAPGIRLGYRF